MKLILSTFKKILFWPYERGSWQYDIMVVAILAFIFFAPNERFHSHRSSAADVEVSAAKRPIFVSRDEVGAVGQDTLEQRISDMLSSKYGHRVEVGRVERVIDDSMKLTGYLAWEK